MSTPAKFKYLNRLTLITGLRGTGKTFLAESLAASPLMAAYGRPLIFDLDLEGQRQLTRTRLAGLLTKGRVILTAETTQPLEALGITHGYRHIHTAGITAPNGQPQ